MHDAESDRLAHRLSELGTPDPNGDLKANRMKTRFFIGVAIVASALGGYTLGATNNQALQIDTAGLDWIVEQVSQNNGVLRQAAEREVLNRLGI